MKKIKDKTIILVNGKARVGKDFVTSRMINILNNKTEHYLIATRIAFADKLKEYACKLFDINYETLDELKNNEVPFTETNTTMREILQRLGTDIIQNVDKLHWVKEVAKYINKTAYKYYFVTDFRFLHEYEIHRFLKKDFKVITVKVIGKDNTDYGKEDWRNFIDVIYK